MAPEGRVIMLVDDDPDFLAVERHVLEAQGYEAWCFVDAQTALERMAQHCPDLVITDLMMKNLDSGFALSRQIKQDARFGHIPVVIVSAVATREGLDFRPRTREDLAAMCADAFLEKPVSPHALLAKIRELLQQGAQANPT